MGGTVATVGSVPCIHCLPLPARPMGWPIVIGQRINKGGEAVASPLVFDRNYFRKPCRLSTSWYLSALVRARYRRSRFLRPTNICRPRRVA